MLFKRNKILVVDDEPDIVQALKHYFCAKGYDVNIAMSGEEALESLEKKGADLILLDIKMPGISGIEVAHIVKEKYPTIKIIMVTGYVQEAQDLEKNSFSEAVFTKPIVADQLHKKMLEVLGRVNLELSQTLILVKAVVLLAIMNASSQDYRNN